MIQLSPLRVAMMGAAGAAGGLVTFAAVNPTIVQTETGAGLGALPPEQRLVTGLTQVLLSGCLLGLTVGGGLIVVEELLGGSLPRLVRRAILGMALGAVTGMVGAIVGQVAFTAVLAAGLLNPGSLQPEGGPVLVVARTLGWSAVGAAAGLCPGVVAGAWRRGLQGVVGGALGGAAGGVVFDLLASTTQSGTPARAVGFVVIGLAVGTAVSLVEELAKQFWLTGLTGAREGRVYNLARARTVIGRDELADIPVFGDPSVERQHAYVDLDGRSAVVAAAPGALVTINRYPVAGAALADGDVLGIGRHLFRFNARRASAPLLGPRPEARPGIGPQPASQPAPWAGAQQAASPYAQAGAGTVAGGPTLALEALSGPHAGQVFAVPAGGVIGRDPGCAVLLDRDMRVSRQHARIAGDAAGWRAEDLGSTNGLWADGVRVGVCPLAPARQVTVGDTVLRVGTGPGHDPRF